MGVLNVASQRVDVCQALLTLPLHVTRTALLAAINERRGRAALLEGGAIAVLMSLLVSEAVPSSLPDAGNPSSPTPDAVVIELLDALLDELTGAAIAPHGG